MRISKQRLKQIIKEELSKVLNETTDVDGDGDTDPQDVFAVAKAMVGDGGFSFHDFKPKNEKEARDYFHDYVADEKEGLYAEYDVDAAIDDLTKWMRKYRQYFQKELATIDRNGDPFSGVHQSARISRGLGQ